MAIIDLPEGEHEFTYEVDGDTLTDNVHEIVADDSGKKHNKTVIREKDFIDLENELLRDPNDIGNWSYICRASQEFPWFWIQLMFYD